MVWIEICLVTTLFILPASGPVIRIPDVSFPVSAGCACQPSTSLAGILGGKCRDPGGNVGTP